tara:strand:- start:9171 stop:9542 length:372 start_codon:yes stop_codon:yes gene_type:complete
MAFSRYKDTGVILNDDLDYKKVFVKRFGRDGLDNIQRVSYLKHLETLELKYPTLADIVNLSFTNYIWSQGDRFYKLSHEFYGDARYWWVIAWFNKKPTDHHVSVGDLIKVPTPLEEILNAIGL